MQPDSSFITTVAMPLNVRAELDVVKAQRAERSGKRPTTTALVVEALVAFLATQRKRRGSR